MQVYLHSVLQETVFILKILHKLFKQKLCRPILAILKVFPYSVFEKHWKSLNNFRVKQKELYDFVDFRFYWKVYYFNKTAYTLHFVYIFFITYIFKRRIWCVFSFILRSGFYFQKFKKLLGFFLFTHNTATRIVDATGNLLSKTRTPLLDKRFNHFISEI